jgi:hypothetical protein
MPAVTILFVPRPKPLAILLYENGHCHKSTESYQLMLRTPPQKEYHFRMEKEKLELYTDYLICNSGYATATGLSTMLEGDMSHDQVTRFMSVREYTSKDLWRKVKT